MPGIGWLRSTRKCRRIQMSDVLPLALALFAGALLGVVFFGGLWWTVQKGVTSETPALWFLGSLVLRFGVILTGFYVVSQNHWSRFVACLIGFLMARVIVVRRLMRPPAGQAFQLDSRDVGLESPTYEKEAGHDGS